MWRIGVFLAGLACVALGFALAVLPGPLTIPPILLGLWVWSTEFQWARRFFAVFRRKARDAWAHARQHPVSSIVITVGGLAAAGVAVWAVGHFQLVDRAREALGA
jgi:Putative transmembrane protein (PGPGW)